MDPAPVLVPAGRGDQGCIENMMQLYTYDFSEWVPLSLGPDGKFVVPAISSYWDEDTRHPFLIRVGEQLAGFALVNSVIVDPASDFNVGEFFITRRFRRRGVGRSAARQLFERFRGAWEVYQLQENHSATLFWRNAISDFVGAFEEVRLRIGNHDCIQQRFSSLLLESSPTHHQS